MRNKDNYAVAVRSSDGEIVVKQDEYKGVIPNKTVYKIPIIRGVLSFIDSLVLGLTTLNYSSDIYMQGEEIKEAAESGKTDKEAEHNTEEVTESGKTDKEVEHNTEEATEAEKAAEASEQPESQAEKSVEASEQPESQAEKAAEASEQPESQAEKAAEAEADQATRPDSDHQASSDRKKAGDAVLSAVVTVVALILAMGLFMVLPYFASQFFKPYVGDGIALSLIEGLIRIIIFIGYIKVISLMDDIKRVFMYHGAEHKCINCIENGMPLTVENVRKSSREHKRCGTSFLLYVMVISIVFFAFIQTDVRWMRVVLRIVLIPVIAGVSYEFIRLAGRCDNALVGIISKPGLWLQKLTTREPDDQMIEVGIRSVDAVFDWKGFLQENFPDDV
ncbi:MAG: DUF1385 domain-containing protein [Lachnospiraceae bacterium]|nr:DUF1385 domain-containing protein [Lachnospiraceae bacterium]